MDAILFVLRTGCQWNALNGAGICSSSSAHRRFQEWVDAGVFEEVWMQGLLNATALREIDWSWLALDGAMTKAPPGGEKTGPNPTDRGQGGVKRSVLTDGNGIPLAVDRWPQPARHEAGQTDAGGAESRAAFFADSVAARFVHG
jgi:putative transposase